MGIAHGYDNEHAISHKGVELYDLANLLLSPFWQ
jgi:hypothetical protein